MSTVTWVRDFDAALTRAQGEGKLVLLDFFSPV